MFFIWFGQSIACALMLLPSSLMPRIAELLLLPFFGTWRWFVAAAANVVGCLKGWPGKRSTAAGHSQSRCRTMKSTCGRTFGPWVSSVCLAPTFSWLFAPSRLMSAADDVISSTAHTANSQQPAAKRSTNLVCSLAQFHFIFQPADKLKLKLQQNISICICVVWAAWAVVRYFKVNVCENFFPFVLGCYYSGFCYKYHTPKYIYVDI